MSAAPSPRVRCVDQAGAVLGEGPVWVAREQALYWVDIKGRRLHRHDPVSGSNEAWTTPFAVGAIAPRAGGGFVAATGHGFALLDMPGGAWTPIGDPEPELPRNRFNDGNVDAAGRFWAGTMDDAETASSGSLYRLEADRRWQRADSGYRVPNGPAFSPDGMRLYHTDSPLRTIYRFDVSDDGSLRNKTVFARFGGGDGYPDGMTVDAQGCLWVAFWDGWCVRRLSEAGAVIATLELPVQRPTSCSFGGTMLDQLFVTSARAGLHAAARAVQPLAGGLFVAEPGVCGISGTPFAG